ADLTVCRGYVHAIEYLEYEDAADTADEGISDGHSNIRSRSESKRIDTTGRHSATVATACKWCVPPPDIGGAAAHGDRRDCAVRSRIHSAGNEHDYLSTPPATIADGDAVKCDRGGIPCCYG